MRIINLILIIVVGVISLSLLNACQHDPIIPPDPIPFCDTSSISYNNGIKAIVDNSCAYAGCHFNGAMIGDFSSYQGMLPRLQSGLIKTKVVDLVADEEHGMPPFYVPDDKPEDLTAEEFDLFQCWLSKNFPE